jgi:hypothetical protein
MNRLIRFWLPSLADIFFLCPFLILAFNSGNNLLSDADTGYHIRTGEYIINHLTVPQNDLFSHITPPLPWFAHEWLSEVVMALVHTFSGLTGVVLFFSFLISVTYFLLFKYSQSLNCNIVFTVLIVLLATLSSSLHWLARPHIFSLLLTVVWYNLLNNYQYQGRDRLYLLPPLMLLWVNLHGGFILGFVLLGVYFTGNVIAALSRDELKRKLALERCRKLAVFTAGALLFTLLNPRGYDILLFPFRTVSNQFLMDNVLEFFSPNFHGALPYKYLLLLTIAVVALSRKGIDLIELALLVLFTYMSLYSARYIPLFAIIVTPILLKQLQSILRRCDNRLAQFFEQRSRNLELLDARASGHLWPIISVLAVCALALNGTIEFKFDASRKPVAAVEFLQREKLPGKMFNDDEFGDYVIYAAWPEYKVFFDGRSDMYGEAWGSQYVSVVRLQSDWENIIEKNNFSWIFVSAGSPLTIVLLEKHNWHLIYADKVAQIFVKNIPQNRALINKYPDVKPVLAKEAEAK